MERFSHSKISSFEQCPQKYKFRYIDKIKPKIEKSIEVHLGSCVHHSLEWLYLSVKEGKIPTLEDLIVIYSERWQEKYKPEYLIVRKELTAKDYFNKGVEFIVNYYLQNQPFSDNTLEVEKEIVITLGEEEYKIWGFIDRLAYNLETGEYEVHDYKTANSLPSKERIESDRQLALYSIAVKQIFGNDKEVKLIWHFLAYNKKIEIKKTDEEIEKVKEKTISAIKEIISAKEFPPKKSRLCDWCEFKDICPAWGNSLEKQREKEKENIENYPFLKKFIKE